MIELYLKGQCPSGKNAVVVTRTGHRFPAKRFKEWREDALLQLKPQLTKWKDCLPFNRPISIQVYYTTKDLRRRDVPGILDAIWHLLEKANIVTDDTFLGGHGEQVLFHNRGKVIKPEIIIKLMG
jgi:Holliday junction resolvase RusA-like endonuclease